MRNLDFERQVIRRPDGDGMLVRIISRASNDEGEFIVHKTGWASSTDERHVQMIEMTVIMDCALDENHIKLGYGAPVAWPLKIKIKRWLRKWAGAVLAPAR